MHTQTDLKEDDYPRGFLEFRWQIERISATACYLYCTDYYVPTYPGRFYFNFSVVNSLNLLEIVGEH